MEIRRAQPSDARAIADIIVPTFREAAGGGRHVCNCGYITRAGAAGGGIGRAMCLHSLAHARSRGYRAGAFEHPSCGFVDALVMYRLL
jgi:predicted GNAT family acetyltransferase